MNISQLLRDTFVAEVEHHGELVSTNDRAIQRANFGANKLPLLVIADRQTAGRGRAGNRWWTGTGSLAFSLLLEPTANEPAATSLLSFATGVAVVEALQQFLPSKIVGLHWPNDIMVSDKKISGILVEVLPDGHTIIGVGINTNNSTTEAPAELKPIVTTLFDLTGRHFDHTEILISLLNRLERHIVTLKHVPSQICMLADSLCLQKEKPISLQLGSQTIDGLCKGISQDGAILIQTTDGTRSFYSGTILKTLSK